MHERHSKNGKIAGLSIEKNSYFGTYLITLEADRFAINSVNIIGEFEDSGFLFLVLRYAGYSETPICATTKKAAAEAKMMESLIHDSIEDDKIPEFRIYRTDNVTEIVAGWYKYRCVQVSRCEE